MDGDWPLPRPTPLFKKVDRRSAGSAIRKSSSIASTFSSLATPVVAEAVLKARALSTNCEAEDFHQLRVAFRKLRALYWAYSPYLGEDATVEAIEEFKRLAAVAGGTRDWDIAGELIDAAQKSDATLELLSAAAREKRAEAVAQSQAMIKGDAVETFLTETLVRAQDALQSRCGNLPVRAFASDRVRQAQRALRKRSRRAVRFHAAKEAAQEAAHDAAREAAHEAAHEEALHDVRKAGKKLRYLLEFFQPVIKGGQDRFIKELTAVQNKLGQFNDIAASEMLIRNASFASVPPDVVSASLRWFEEQKRQHRDAAAQRVRAMAGRG